MNQLPPVLTSPTESATLVALLFFVVDMLKSVLGIGGQKNKVRFLALALGIGISLTDAVFGGAQVPPLTGNLVYLALLRGVILTITTFGANTLRDSAGTGAGAVAGDTPPPDAAPPPDIHADRTLEMTPQAYTGK